MKRKVIIILLLVAMVSQFIPFVAAEEPTKNGYYTWDGYYIPTEEEVYNSIVAMQEQYPEGMTWTNDNIYSGPNGGGGGCHGFAVLLSDVAFGNIPGYTIRDFTYDDIRVGDIFRYENDAHSVIILEKCEEYCVVAEGNFVGTIHWFRKVKRSIIEAGDWIATRYPLHPNCAPEAPVITVHVAPTCNTMGQHIYTYYCKDCGVFLKEESKIVPPLGHDFSEFVHTCYPTPSSQGYDLYKCIRCNQTEKRNYIDAHNHKYGNAVVENYIAPTCTEAGSYETVYYCAICNKESLRKFFTTNALGHDFSVKKEIVSPTVGKDGYTVYQCSRCEETEHRDFTQYHVCTPASAVVENNVPAQCTVDGGYDLVVYCSVCKKELSREHKVVSATGHNFSIKVETIPPTDTEEGYTVYRCQYCTATERRDFIPIHTCTPSAPIKINEIAPTCEKEGGYDSIIRCAECGKEISREHITQNALGHNYTDTVIPPLCVEEGYTLHSCTRCSHSYKDAYLDATGHDYRESVVTPPTCENQGFTTHICYDCKHSYTDAFVPALGHDIVIDAGIPANCIEGGYTEGCHCTRCDYKVEREIISELGHSWDDGVVIKEPTETETGTRLYTCTRCEATEKREIEKLKPVETVDPCLNFTDVIRTEWYHNAIDFAITSGYMNGVASNKFDPEGDMTRAQLVQILYNLEGKPAVAYSDIFKDVLASDWFAKAVIWAAQNGVVTGVGDRKFDPDSSITREQMATILFRYFASKGDDTTARADINKFSDGDTVSDWAVEAFRWANGAGVINGSTEGKVVLLIPQGTATRSQVAQVFYNYFCHKEFCGASEPEKPFFNQVDTESNHEHDYQSEVVEPTCTAKGYTKHTCSCGISYKDNYVDAVGHQYTDTVIAPTVFSEGYTEHTCVRCGNSYKDNYSEKLPNDGKKIYDISAAVAVGNAYAQSMGATIDYSLGFDNAGYSFPVHYTPDYPNYANTDFQTFMSICIQGCVDEVKSLGEMRGHAFDVYRINCYIEYYADYNSYWFYVFYG